MRLDFHIKNRLKLSATYLAIIMFLCIIFSVALYEVSSSEVEHGLRPVPNQQGAKPMEYDVFERFEEIRDERVGESSNFLKRRLFLLNVYALVLGSLLSYLLAAKALKPIENAMEKQDRFASDASHELRTPLSAMQSEIEVALRDKDLKSGEAREILESNLDEVKKMTTISSALLSLARSENQEKEFVKCNVLELIDEAIEDTKVNARDKDIKVEKNASSELSIKADRDKLRQLFVIILDNAFKYSEKDSLVKVSAINVHKHLQIDIADQGIGIEKEDRPYIFDRFYRADSSRTKNEKNGFGLGLSIAKNIVELHGGKIEALENSPKGTIIRITL